MKTGTLYIKRKNSGSVVLYTICATLLGVFLLVLSFQRFKSGQVNQLNKSISQEKMAAIAQSGVNELIAVIRAQINKKNNEFSNAVEAVVKKDSKSSSFNISAQSLNRSNAIAKQILRDSAVVSGQISLNITETLGNLDKSHMGLISFAAVNGN